MQKREKLLAMVAVSMVAILVLYFAGNWALDLVDAREKVHQDLERRNEAKRLTILKGKIASERQAEWLRRSLPSDLQHAKALYQDWLLGQIKQAGLREPVVTPAPTRTAKRTDRKTSRRGRRRRPGSHDVYHKLTVTIGCRGTLDQLTAFLYQIYHADHLHQVRRLHITPIEKTRDLDLSLTIEALALPDANNATTLSEAPGQALVHGDLKKYRDVILARNLFGPPNRPPRLAPISDSSVKLGQPVALTAKATDEDTLDKVVYRLDGAPHGAAIDTAAGTFRWKPSADQGPGRYTFRIVATDDGLPPRSDSHSFTVTIRKPLLKLAALPKHTIKPGESVRVNVSLAESDPTAKVTYALSDDAPKGAVIDAATGVLRWTPTEAQCKQPSHTLTVRVTDDATPMRTDRASLIVAIVRPTPKGLELDVVARHTFVTAIVEVDGQRQVWLELRTTGERPRLRKGERLKAGSFDGVVAAIRPLEVDFRAGGQLYTVELGRSLAEAVGPLDGGL